VSANDECGRQAVTDKVQAAIANNTELEGKLEKALEFIEKVSAARVMDTHSAGRVIDAQWQEEAELLRAALAGQGVSAASGKERDGQH
jgi:hypothetical protein